TFARSNYYIPVLWIFNITILILNRIYEGYPFSLFGQQLAFLDNYRGTFRWHICFNLVVLRMISFGCDYHWSFGQPRFDKKRHVQRCHVCSSGRTCYHALQEIGVHSSKYSFNMYLCHLIYAPLYIAGPIISYNAFAKQLEAPQENYSVRQISAYGLRWVLSFLLMEAMTHFFYYNAFAISCHHLRSFSLATGVKLYVVKVSPDLALFSVLIGGIETPENMPRCMNNCYDLESFWKGWHASFNKWLVRYMYIPLGGSQRKLLNVWVIFTFVAIWHDLEWKLLSWAWLTCLFFVPELLVKSAADAFQARSAFGAFIHRELGAIAGAVTISCLMVANLVGYVVGPSGVKSLISRMLQKDAYPVLVYIFISFYVGVKLMFHIRDLK
ncbi:putative membrane-bound O-acyltransferase C24H6.01c, partial [Ananas comosus]